MEVCLDNDLLESVGAEAKGAPPVEPDNRFHWASLALSLSAMLLALSFGLLPLALGLLAARSGSLALARSRLLRARGSLAALTASLVVGFAALGLCIGASVWLFESASSAIKESPVLVKKLAEQAREAKNKLPPAIADRIPSEDDEFQEFASGIMSKSLPNIAGAGKSWGGGIILAAIGWIIGLLMANMKAADPASGPLAIALRERGQRMSSIFEQVVAGQFVVACANTFFAALFMLALLPLFGESMPWAGALIGVTFVLSMIPAAGNVLCNGIVTLVALSVGPGVALSALAYLIVVHKVEYFINAKAVGRRVSTSVWELLLSMVVLECIFGVGGLVAAPLFYAYAKSEMRALGWV